MYVLLEHPLPQCTSHNLSDFLLAACDVEGNFLVIKVRFCSLRDLGPYLFTLPLNFCHSCHPSGANTCRSLLTGLSVHGPVIVHVVGRVSISFFCCSFVNARLSVYTCSWAIPVCLFFSWVYMRTKYHWTQILVCVFT